MKGINMAETLTAEDKELLEMPALAYVGTTMKDGMPQVSPVWIDHDGENVIFNSETKRAKPRNLRRDPRISISVADPKNPYSYIEVRGRVSEITEKGASEHIDKMAKKYMGQDKYPLHQPGDVRVIIKVKPERIYRMAR